VVGSESLCGSAWFGSVWGGILGGILGGIARAGFSHRESALPASRTGPGHGSADSAWFGSVWGGILGGILGGIARGIWDFPTERVLSRTPLIIRTVDQIVCLLGALRVRLWLWREE